MVSMIGIVITDLTQGCKSGHFFLMRFESKIGNFKLQNRCVSNRPLVKIKNALRIDAYFFLVEIRNRIDALTPMSKLKTHPP